MSKAWQANVPGLIFYGIIILNILIMVFIKPFTGLLENDENVLWVINIIAEKSPFLFQFFSEFHFLGNYILTVFAIAFICMLIWLVGYQAFVNEKTRSDNSAVQLGRYMYVPLIIVLILLFFMSLFMAVYFYPNI